MAFDTRLPNALCSSLRLPRKAGTLATDGQAMAAGAEALCASDAQLRQQIFHVDLFFAGGRVRSFKSRQRQQVVHQGSACRFVWSLIRRAILLPLLATHRARHRRKVLEEAADYGQRRAQFVRDVGDEGAAHRLDAPERR
jgi:hypothetical protein